MAKNTKHVFRSVDLERVLETREDVARIILINTKVAVNDGWGKYNLTPVGIVLNALLSTAEESHLARIAPQFGIEVTPIPAEQQEVVTSFGFQEVGERKEIGSTLTITGAENQADEKSAPAVASKPGQFKAGVKKTS